MGSMLQCLFRLCCEQNDDDEEDTVLGDTSEREPAMAGHTSERMSRSYQVAPSNSSTGRDCCIPAPPEGVSTSTAHPLLDNLMRTFRERWGLYDSFTAIDEEEPLSKHSLSPLRTASSFDASKEVPAILPDEIVLPGSQLQYLMAKSMMAQLDDTREEDECVLCMEPFSPSNPKMPTICGCGENKTLFHLACLITWVEQGADGTCPSCRQKLEWQEL